jgi:hypothetical protein
MMWLRRRFAGPQRRREPEAADMGTAFGMEISLMPDSTLEAEAAAEVKAGRRAGLSRPMYLIHPGA